MFVPLATEPRNIIDCACGNGPNSYALESPRLSGEIVVLVSMLVFKESGFSYDIYVASI